MGGLEVFAQREALYIGKLDLGACAESFCATRDEERRVYKIGEVHVVTGGAWMGEESEPRVRTSAEGLWRHVKGHGGEL
jgi:hypothetical protein